MIDDEPKIGDQVLGMVIATGRWTGGYETKGEADCSADAAQSKKHLHREALK